MMNNSSNYKKVVKGGFTLVELLIVIGILAILSIAVLLVLNPAEILRKGRDTQRISDLAAIKSAISLYSATAASPDVSSIADGCLDEAGDDEIVISLIQGANTMAPPTGYNFDSVAAISTGQTDGDGWIPTNITGTTGGASLSTWPIDPTNTGDSTYSAAVNGNTGTDFYYQWWCNGTNNTFAAVANMESNHYGGTSPTDAIEEKDGGRCGELYEVGTDLSLGPTGADACKI